MKCVAILFSVLVLAGCADKSTSPTTPEPNVEPPLRTVAELTGDEKELVTATNAFGFDLFQRIIAAEPVDKNVFISPLSASYALAMAYNGANGDTRAAMAQTLRIDGLDIAKANLAYQQLTRILMNTDPAVAFSIANAIWYRLGIPVNPAYVTTMESFFGAKITGLDFTLPGSADTINDWAKETTNGKITKVVEPPLDPSTLFMLMNAIYFKGSWTYPFDAERTFSWQFRTETGEQVTTSLMRKGGQEDWQLYPGSASDLVVFQNDTVAMISLPYGQKNFRMAVICPKSKFTSSGVVNMLTPELWAGWRGGLISDDFDLVLPRFRHEYEVTMNDMLAAMGMDIAFGGSADFGGLTSTPMDFFISAVKQNSFVQVDEKGTEAAAVTTIIIATSLPPQIICDHPFIYVIYEETSGAILFLGRLGRPEWNE